ncbi:MAG: Clp protease N-terminal domain-containing protein [Planctomycetota bacterium]
MHERFSDRARHALALANLEATRLNHNYLAPTHILLGLIAEGACVATEALRVLDVDPDKVRQAIASRVRRGEPGSTIGRRAHTEETRQVISLAIDEARGFGHRYVGTEHLMLGLLQVRDGVPGEVLREQGIELERLREKVVALLHTSVDPAHDLAHSRHGEFEWMHQQELAKAFRSPKFWHTLILAVDSANRFGAGEVEPQHLLLALVRDASTLVAKKLGEHGITDEWIRQNFSLQPSQT